MADIIEGLRISMEFFIQILSGTEPVISKPTQRATLCKVLYSDAGWSERSDLTNSPEGEHCKTHSTGMGAIIFAKPQVSAGCGQAPGSIVKALQSRETQIIALELLAVAGALNTFRQAVAGHDIIVFCD